MDPRWNVAPPAGLQLEIISFHIVVINHVSSSITCMLCRGSVPFAKDDTQHFRSHLQHHHGVFYHHEVLISVNVLSKGYLSKIVQEYERSGDKSELVGEEDMEEVIELEEAADQVSNNSVILPDRNKVKKDEVKVHNCKTCNAKFGNLSDLIDHVNEHNADERRKQEEVETKRQALEIERRRLVEEKRVIKQQKAIEKKRLEGEKVKMQKEFDDNRKSELEKIKEIDDNARNRKDVERSRDIAEVRAGLQQIREAHSIEESPVANKEPVRNVEHSNPAVDNNHRPIIFECPECPYTAKRNIELKLHKLSHTEEKNITCEHCNEKFYLERQLKRHLLKHTQEFSKKFNLNKAVIDEPRQFVEMDLSLQLKPYEDEAMISKDLSQYNPDLDLSLPNKKKKQPKVESAQDKIMNVLSEDSNPENPRPKSRASLSKGVCEIAAKSEYFQKFPKQIKKSSSADERFDRQEQSMPEGWKYRELSARANGRVDLEYCSPDFMVFRSRRAMIEYMKVMGRYSQEEMDRAEKGN